MKTLCCNCHERWSKKGDLCCRCIPKVKAKADKVKKKLEKGEVFTASDFNLSKTDYMHNALCFLYAVGALQGFIDSVESDPEVSFYSENRNINFVGDRSIPSEVLEQYEVVNVSKGSLSQTLVSPKSRRPKG